ncbi:hypothetical protein N665_1665s0016 [Sinapis alba]|nr:hypothetical protein N665_1665s0016 [Sinapis alba]
MTFEEVEPTKNTKTVPEPPLSFSSLPDEITENILARVSRWNYPSLSLVSKSFHTLLSSKEIYKTRSQIGANETCVYVLLKFPDNPSTSWFSLRTKPNNKNRTKRRRRKIEFKRDSSLMSVVPIPSSSTIFFPHVVVCQDIYIMGGSCNEPSSSVRIFDCRSHTWRDGPNMTVARAHADTVLLDEKIYVMGGCDIDKYYANWIEVFDVQTQSWTAFPGPDLDELCNHLRQRHYYHVNAFEGEIYLVTEDKEYTYESKNGTWKLVEETSSFLFYEFVEVWCEMGNVIYCCTEDGYLMWSAFEGKSKSREWREIKGLENLLEQPNMGLKTGCEFELVDSGGKLLVMWHQGNSRNRIWYAKISLESRCNGREVWGNVECVDVLTFPVESYECFFCVAALV